MSASPQFEIILVELWHCDEGHLKSLDAFQMLHADMVKYKDQLMVQLCDRLVEVKPGVVVKRITYRDEDGDSCTLTSDTLTDALAFVVPAGGPLSVNGRLQLHVVFNDNPIQPKPACSAVQQSLEDAVLAEINILAEGVDLRLLVPKLAVSALQIVELMQEPALFQFVEMLVDFRDGKLTAADLPQVMHKTMPAFMELPAEIQSQAVKMFRNEAAKVGKAADIQQSEQKGPQGAGVEVHCGVTCDACNKNPIIGSRFKSLEREDYDLCADCYGHPERLPEQFARVMSSTLGDVVSSYYSSVAEKGQPVHAGVECDGCQMCPIVGQRFNKVGHDYDLCGACYESKEDPRDWQEMTITPDTHLVPVPVTTVADENVLGVNDNTRDCVDISADVDAVADAEMHAADDVKAMLSTPGMAKAALTALPGALDDSTCAELMTSLLSHSNEAVRMAVQSALQRASGSQSAAAQETCSCFDETTASPVAEPDLGVTSAPANSSSFDQLALMLNQVPIDMPTQLPTEASEAVAEDNEDALSSVSPNNDKLDVDEEESEDVMAGPEQVTSSTGCDPNATGTRTDAVEDWLLL